MNWNNMAPPAVERKVAMMGYRSVGKINLVAR